MSFARWLNCACVPAIFLGTGGCFDTSSPTVSENDRDYLGDSLEFRIMLPAYDVEYQDTRPEAWQGADAVSLRFEHQKNGIYSTSIFTMAGDRPIDGIWYDPDFDGGAFFTANLDVLEQSDAYSLILVDLNTTVDGVNYTAFVLLSLESASFMGYLPCRHASEIELKNDWQRIRCDEGPARFGLLPFGAVSFGELKVGQTKLELFQDLVRRRLMVFAVDCDEFPEFETGAFGFETSCFSWEEN